MLHEIKVFDAQGHLTKVISREEATKIHQKQYKFDMRYKSWTDILAASGGFGSSKMWDDNNLKEEFILSKGIFGFSR